MAGYAQNTLVVYQQAAAVIREVVGVSAVVLCVLVLHTPGSVCLVLCVLCYTCRVVLVLSCVSCVTHAGSLLSCVSCVTHAGPVVRFLSIVCKVLD